MIARDSNLLWIAVVLVASACAPGKAASQTDIAMREDSRQCTRIIVKATDGALLCGSIIDDRISLPLQRLNLSGRCYDIALSPDGKTLAYTRYSGTDRRLERYIELLDIATRETRRLTAIESHNSHNARWSRDGQQLMFKTLNVNFRFWDIGIVSFDNTGFRVLDRIRIAMGRFGPITWGRSDTTVYCGDLDKLCELDSLGFPVRTFHLTVLVPEGMFSSAWNMDLSHDGKTMLLDTELPDNEVRWHTGGRGAIYALDLSTESAVRVSPNNISACDPTWLDNTRYLFCGIPLTRKNIAAINRDRLPKSNLYLGHLGLRDAILLHHDIWEYSVSAVLRK